MIRSTFILLTAIIIKLLEVDAFSNGRYNNRALHLKIEPESCDYNMCEYVENYPSDAISQLVEKNNELQSYFGTIIEPSRILSIFDRFDDDIPREKQLCETRVVTRKPQVVKDIYGKKILSVNLKGAEQILTFEVCTNPDDTCFETLIHRAVCQQKYTSIGLVTVDSKYFNLGISKVIVPTTCVCTYV